MFGPLKIVPSADLGRIGPQQGETTSYNWKWYYSASGLIIWLALILAVVIPKANHNLQVLWIVVPLVVANLLWLAFKQASDMPSRVAAFYDTLFQSMVISITVLWLTANHFRKLVGGARFFFSFGTVLIVASLGTLPYYTGFSRDTFLFSVLFVIITLALLLAMTLSSILCRKQYKPGYFMLWLALWTLIGSIVAISICYAVSIFYSVLITGTGTRPPWSDLPRLILQLAIPGLIFGLLVYMLNLPYMILGFAHHFFRERFCTCLGLTVKSGAGLDGLDGNESLTN